MNTNIEKVDKVSVDPLLKQYVPYALARRYNIIPINKQNNDLYIAIAAPINQRVLDELRILSDMSIIPVLASSTEITAALVELYGNDDVEKAIMDYQNAPENNILNEMPLDYDRNFISTAPIIRLVNSIIEEAVSINASDIHIEPNDDSIRVRYRIDGRLKIRMTIPKDLYTALLTRIKIISNLNISERRLPQDGRFEGTFNNCDVDLRISIIPTIHGEKVVIRILNRSAILYTKEELGFTNEDSIKYDKLLKNPDGVILLTGPSGSGKTTTLYTMLNQLNTKENNIITIEDPVEYVLDGISQIQVHEKIGLNFINGLKAILRQDPDIIMVGEIRDEETAEIALRAGITGHLVLSTLHTTDSISAIFRLRDMGIPLYMIIASIKGIISQRLLRKLCPQCSKEYEYSENNVTGLNLRKSTILKKAIGCSHCNYTGYKGRIAVHEFLIFNDELREILQNECTLSNIKNYIIKNKLPTLKDECMNLLLTGTTTIDECLKAIYSNDL